MDSPHLDPTSEPPLDLLAGGSLPSAWASAWESNPDSVALVVNGAAVTNAKLRELSATAAAKLAGAGINAGDRVLMSCSTSLDQIVAHVACIRMGAVVIPTNTAYQARELHHVINDAQPAGVIIDDPARRADAAQVDHQVKLLSAPDLGDFVPGTKSPLDLALADDPALIGYTSGTTGAPKGAVLSHGNLLASNRALLHAWRWTSSDRLVLALPLFHMHGLGVGLHGTLLAGASAVVLPRFDVDAVVAAIREHSATMFFGVPTMYHRLIAAATADSGVAEALASLRLCVSGSAPLRADAHNQFEALTGQRILERYGMTETAMLTSNPFDGERRAGTVGFPLPGVDLKLEPETSEVLVKGPNVFDGYLNRPEANRDAFVNGWFRTGDLGSVSDEGYVTLNGRSSELIISGGFNVYPREVEDTLRRIPTVVDAAVVGTQDAEWGEIVTAYCVGSEPLDFDAIKTALDTELADFKRPRIFHQVSELPRNAMGKIQKHRLGAAD